MCPWGSPAHHHDRDDCREGKKRMREDDRRTELFGGTMGGDARGPGPPPLKSCNKLFERKDDGLGEFKNKDYYREGTSMGVRDIIRRFEDIRTSAGVEEIQGCRLGGPEKSVMIQYILYL